MEVVKKSTYDPNKKYVWTPETQFTLSGSEFGGILNLLRSTLSTPEAARILMASQMNDLIESILAAAVEDGRVKEAEDQP